MTARTLGSTAFALTAFASNSLLCRLALGGEAIDPATFTSIRLASGAATLLLVRAAVTGRGAVTRRGDWVSGSMLFAYASAFSFAYISLSAGMGALILFGSVQATMTIAALRSGARFLRLEAIGLLLAVAGLAYLVSPGITAPSPVGFILMTMAGVSWGIYSLRGRRVVDSLADTTTNFVLALPLAAGVTLLALRNFHASPAGILLAILSGALASGIGYVVWYAALKGLTAIQAASVQLSVPALAAMGGVLFLSEHVSTRLAVSGIAILGGVALVLAGRERGRPGARDTG